METTKYIFGESEYVENAGHIYPVKMRDYDKFQECVYPLRFRREHFDEKFNQYPLFDLVIFGIDKDFNKTISVLEKLFSLATQKEVNWVFDQDSSQYAFIIGDEHWIDNKNYENVRQIIMKQNLIFEQKIYKNALVRKFAEAKLKHMQKNSIDITIEDMITTVVASTGISFESIKEMTIYQLNSIFKRVSKIEDYRVAIQFKCAGAEKVKVSHFAENLHMFKSPYDDIFVSKDRLQKINEAIGR